MKKWMLAGMPLLLNAAALAEEYYVEEESSGMGFIIVLVVALIVALVVVGIMKSKLKIAAHKRGADNYVRKGSFKLTARQDHFLYETVSRRKIETEKKN